MTVHVGRMRKLALRRDAEKRSLAQRSSTGYRGVTFHQSADCYKPVRNAAGVAEFEDGGKVLRCDLKKCPHCGMGFPIHKSGNYVACGKCGALTCGRECCLPTKHHGG